MSWLTRLKEREEAHSATKAVAKLEQPQQPCGGAITPVLVRQLNGVPYPTLEHLGMAALRACFALGDGPRARRQMLDDCASLAADERQGWIDHFCSHYGPIPVQPHQSAPTGSEQREPANDPTFLDWRELDRAYLDHHAHCLQCKTAGRRRGERCSIGAALWRSYEEAPVPWAAKGGRK
ncbi:hypothetical protein [Brachymonas denitrificans]|uniref:hypothetical protein n=1 Tax=Brachymonas denitrificans TaxID=28220 RepID=UPI001BCAF0DA|nr:hypothetical protein [Brachymonas denitrificans]